MQTELRDQIRELIEGGARPVTASEIFSRGPGMRARPGTVLRPAAAGSGARLRRAAAIAAAVAAVGCACAVAAAGLTGPSGQARTGNTGVVLTAAMVRYVAAESGAALGQSGRARIASRYLLGGVLQQSGTDDITFSGSNYNLVLHETLPAADGQPATAQSAVNRVVDGQAYDYFAGEDGLRWYHVTGRQAVAALSIPDPRTLLRALEPGARFRRVGYQMIAGVRLGHLRATDLPPLPGLGSIPQAHPGQQVAALDVWVDGHGIVRRIDLVLRGSTRVASFHATPENKGLIQRYLRDVSRLTGGRGLAGLSPARVRAIMSTPEIRRDQELIKHAGAYSPLHPVSEVTTLSVSFTDIGRPQVITAPPGAVTVHGLG